jgi:protein-L-isoaspartate(D-aspartate) O-methyltransferase
VPVKVAMRTEDLEALREHMLAVIAASAFELRGAIGKNALDERVMTAMRKVPRHAFVPIELRPYAYENIPLPIGFAKTISQPFLVALMTDLLDIKADDSVLEIGTGLGYQAAILAQGPEIRLPLFPREQTQIGHRRRSVSCRLCCKSLFRVANKIS